ncbi:MAG: GNAT family N-acetyltransferase [Ruminococcus sp.]|nr:GNAT family N-acetyltransferase [Ruminococcus sp.]MCM1380488.1 GNAT family N-acetyltransferase [Muribaculaceae bacterium]
MNTEIYELFVKSFPQFPMTETVFDKLLDPGSCKMITHCEDGKLAGCAAVSGNCIRLICVAPEYRGMGIGHVLMRKCEKFIAENGFKTAILGGRDSRLFIGAVTPEEQWQNMRNKFFENEGYTARNGCLEMRMNVGGFSLDGLDIPPCPDNVTFEYISEDRREELLAAVKNVNEGWVRHFAPDSPVFAALADGKIASFCIVYVNADTVISTAENSVGVIGCVGTVPEERRKGIGLAMVAHAMQDAKNKGCNEIFIHYTYLDWWYGKLGFKTFLHYWFGEKEVGKK